MPMPAIRDDGIAPVRRNGGGAAHANGTAIGARTANTRANGARTGHRDGAGNGRANGGGASLGPDESLLASKITAPALPGWAVRRERVERLIEDGADAPLTVVTGPPGAGKTMALAWWAATRRRPGPTAWVTLDRFDNRPEILWSYIGESLRRCGVAMPPDLGLPAAGRADHAFLQQLASVLASQDPPVALVLDDIHLLSDLGTLDGLSYVLRNASAGLHVLVASRMDPLLPLHRYRLTGELTEIRAADLAFTSAEARALIAQHGVTLSPASLEVLTSKAEGWAAGLRLAAMSLENHPDPEHFASEFGAKQSAVTGYFAEEVLSALPPGIRDVLLRTSILDRVSPALAGVLAGTNGGTSGDGAGAAAGDAAGDGAGDGAGNGDGDAAAVIPRLAEANAFIQPLGGDWYRYHPLFAEVLRLKLRHEHKHDVMLLHRRAAGWLKRNGMLTDAVGQLAAAGDWRLAARMTVEDLAVDELTDPRSSTAIAETFRQLPGAGRESDPPLLLVMAAMRLRDRDGQAGAEWLGRAEQVLEALPPGDELPSRLAARLLRADIARRNGDLRAARAALAGTGLTGEAPREPLSGSPRARAQLLFLCGAVELWAGHLDAAVPMLQQGTAALEGGYGWADCQGYWALLEAIRGRLGLAAGLAAPATVPAVQPDGGPAAACQVSAAAEAAFAWVHLEHSQLDEASDRVSRAEDALRARPDKLISTVTGLIVARYDMAVGHAAAAARIARRARQEWAAPPWLERRLMLTESHAYAAAGNAGAALGAAGHARPLFASDATAALARAQLAAGDLDGARRQLADRRGGPDSAASDAVRLEERLVEAEVGYRGGNPERGRRALEEALRLAEPEQLRLPFAMQRSWIQAEFRRDPSLAAVFRRLFRSGKLTPSWGEDEVAVLNGHPAGPVIVEQLSTREQEVLQYVSGMLSTAEIAGEMYISVNTVKSHLKSIFRKLGASRRGEAVRRARELQLI